MKFRLYLIKLRGADYSGECDWQQGFASNATLASANQHAPRIAVENEKTVKEVDSGARLQTVGSPISASQSAIGDVRTRLARHY